MRLVLLALLTGAECGASRESRSHHDCAEMPPEQHPCFNITGLRQSPIYIDTCRATGSVLRPLRISHLDTVPRQMTLENPGELVLGHVRWSSGYQPTIRGGGLLEEYAFEGLELHWGADNASGSEHVLDGHRFVGELQLVFRNIRYPTTEEALERVNGFVVLVAFYDEAARSPGHGLTALAPGLFQITEAFSRAELLSPPTLRELLPDDLREYVQYEGSATSGTQCAETVTWIVFLTPIRILPVELELLRNLRAVDGSRLCGTLNRPLQPLSGRQLRRKGRTSGCPIPWPQA